MTIQHRNRVSLSEHVYCLGYDLALVIDAILAKAILVRPGRETAVGLPDLLPDAQRCLERLRSSTAGFVADAASIGPVHGATLSRVVSETIQRLEDPTWMSIFANRRPDPALPDAEVGEEAAAEIVGVAKLVYEHIASDDVLSCWWCLGRALAQADWRNPPQGLPADVVPLAHRLYSLTGYDWLSRLIELASRGVGDPVFSKLHEPYVDKDLLCISPPKLDRFIQERLSEQVQARVLLEINDDGLVLFGHHLPRSGFTDAEWRILIYLASSPGKELTRRKIYKAYAGIEGNDDNAVAAHISNLRKKLKPAFDGCLRQSKLPVPTPMKLIAGIRVDGRGGPYKLTLPHDQVEVDTSPN